MNRELKTVLNGVAVLVIAAAIFMIVASFWVGRLKPSYIAVIVMALFFMRRINGQTRNPETKPPEKGDQSQFARK